MSEAPGCGIALARLLAMPVVLGLVGALLPMGLGRPFAWHIGFIVFVLAFSIVLGVCYWRADRCSDPIAGERSERYVGAIALVSGALVIGDGPELRSQVRIDHLPARTWRVKCRTLVSKSASVLDEVILEVDADADAEALPLQDQVIVIDSGEVVVVDAGAATKRLKGGTLREDLDRLRLPTDQAVAGITFLSDALGSASGIAFKPPYGDGNYPVHFGRHGGVLEIRIRVAGDS